MNPASPTNNDSVTRILMIDDDAKLCRLVRDYLRPLGYDVAAAHNGTAGLELALEGGFVAIILDVMLPGLDGLDVLRRLRAQSDVPVLMLTGRGEEPDRIVGLELGADDYLPKTFSTRELLARLRAVIRRSLSTVQKQAEAIQLIQVGDLSIDDGARTVELGGVSVSVTAVEFDILRSLAKAAGRVRTREQLLLEAADRNFEVFDRSIDVHISSLRKKLGDDPKTPRFIVTVRSVGYMMRKPGSEVFA
ncbi:MAG TPA: response regulator transcription factor [Bryobacteraceae bacterium]|jgi:two-component system response regulator CpxR|nr:response regulator transcription factor [Bryobacteraceae bacterium]